MTATWKPAPPSEPKEATRTEWFAWGAAAVAALLLLAGTVTLWQSDESPPLTAITLGQGLVLLFLGVAATVVSAASFVVVALARRWPVGGS